MPKSIIVRAGSGPDDTYDVRTCVTIAAAKRYAQYVISAKYARENEISEPDKYAAVYVNGECIWDTL